MNALANNSLSCFTNEAYFIVLFSITIIVLREGAKNEWSPETHFYLAKSRTEQTESLKLQSFLHLNRVNIKLNIYRLAHLTDWRIKPCECPCVCYFIIHSQQPLCDGEQERGQKDLNPEHFNCFAHLFQTPRRKQLSYLPSAQNSSSDHKEMKWMSGREKV